MRYVTFAPKDGPQAARLGAWTDEAVVELGGASGVPTTMLAFLEAGEAAWATAREVEIGRAHV